MTKAIRLDYTEPIIKQMLEVSGKSELDEVAAYFDISSNILDQINKRKYKIGKIIQYRIVGKGVDSEIIDEYNKKNFGINSSHSLHAIVKNYSSEVMRVSIYIINTLNLDSIDVDVLKYLQSIHDKDERILPIFLLNKKA